MTEEELYLANIPEEEQALKKLTSEEAIALLREGKTLTGVEIGRLVLQGEIDFDIKIERSTIKRFTIGNAEVKGSIAITVCDIKRPQFVESIFHKSVAIKNSIVRSARISECEFMENLRLDLSTIKGMNIAKTKFRKDFRTWNTKFTLWLEVHDSEFFDVVKLRSFQAEEGVQFEKCVFHSDLLFRGSTVMKRFDFTGTRFEGFVDFSKAKMHDFVYLEEIEQGDKQTFGFHNAIFDRLLARREHLEGRIQSEIDGDCQTAMQEYGLLRRNFEMLNRYEAEDWAFYRFKVNDRKSRSQSWLRPWTKCARLANWLFLDLGCGYGAKPFRAILAAFVIIIGFASIYYFGVGQFEVDFAPIEDQPIDSVANRIVFAAITSISVFTAGFTGEHIFTAHGWVLIPLALEALLGTLLWGLFIVAFSRKVIR